MAEKKLRGNYTRSIEDPRRRAVPPEEVIPVAGTPLGVWRLDPGRVAPDDPDWVVVLPRLGVELHCRISYPSAPAARAAAEGFWAGLPDDLRAALESDTGEQLEARAAEFAPHFAADAPVRRGAG